MPQAEIVTRDSALASKGRSNGSARGSAGEIEIMRQRAADHLRLLVDFLGHEVAVIALVDHQRAGLQRLARAFDDPTGGVEECRLFRASASTQSSSSR